MKSLLDVARSSGLRHISDTVPGITRRGTPGRFRYHAPDRTRVSDEAELARIRALAIPPAYTNVWICPDPRGHIQATGRDARGRKQYRYHAKWREARDATKYRHLRDFGRVLPKLRHRVDEALSKPGLSRDHVIAMVVHLLDGTLIRVGNEEYARTNHSYGLTTLRSKHVDVHGDKIRLSFRGKSGVEHDVTIVDRRIARAIHGVMELPGHELFQYVDDNGVRHPIGSSDINAFLHEVAGEEFTAKDYRTWAGSVHALDALRTLPWKSAAESKRNVVATLKQVAARLRNTPAVCKRCYVHPLILEHYAAGALSELGTTRARRHLAAEEVRFLAFLERSA